MKEKVDKAVEYANSSNELENHNLLTSELDQIVEDIMSGKSDESFLYSVVELVKKHQNQNEEEVNGKIRKWFIKL